MRTDQDNDNTMIIELSKTYLINHYREF